MSIEEKIAAAMQYVQEHQDEFPDCYDNDGYSIVEDAAEQYADDQEDFDMICEALAIYA